VSRFEIGREGKPQRGRWRKGEREGGREGEVERETRRESGREGEGGRGRGGATEAERTYVTL